MSRFTLLLLGVACSAGIASAQTVAPIPSPFSGQWQFEITMTGPIRAPSTRGTLIIAPRGDELEARLEWLPGEDGRRSPNRTMAGRVRGDTVVFVEESSGTIAAASQSAEARAVITWQLVLKAQALAGTIAFEVPGVSLPFEPMPVRAVRAPR